MSPKSASLKAKSKQFFELQGTPILIHTLRKFVQCPQVDEIVVALRANETSGFQKQIEHEKFGKLIRIVQGGEHRQNSVVNALTALEAADDDIVLVHDAVRPFIEQETILGVIEAVKKYGAAIAGVPAVDTVKQVDRTSDGAVVIATVPRERMVLAQTPQGFRFGLLKKAFDEATTDGFLGTDEASLIERNGGTVHAS
jgi:2-C-methyl-D-erythritol 4-phosphate cytidylyltransferase